MRELLAKIDQLTKQARAFLDAETPDTVKATELMDQVDVLKQEYELEKRVYDQEKTENVPAESEHQAEKKVEVDPLVALGKAAKARFMVKDTMNETTPADGGYTVPEDIQTKVEEFRDAEFSLLSLVRTEPVTTKSGARTFKSRAQYTGFTEVGEGANIGAVPETPKFQRLTYNIKKYAGYMPLTNELNEDSDANVGRIVVEWLGNESRATANRLILAAIATKTAVDLSDLKGIKKALNVTLGAAFKGSSKIVTNDDGLQYLDTLEDQMHRPLLTPTPADPMKLVLAAGATTVPVAVVPNAVLPTTDNKVPFIIGDLKEGIVFWDRKQRSIMQSNIAQIGELNAFEQDLTIYRAIEREDVKVRDEMAFVNGYITVTGE